MLRSTRLTTGSRASATLADPQQPKSIPRSLWDETPETSEIGQRPKIAAVGRLVRRVPLLSTTRPALAAGLFLCQDFDTRIFTACFLDICQTAVHDLMGARHPANGDRHEHLPLTVIHGQRTRARNHRTRLPYVLCPVYGAGHGAKSFASTSRDAFGYGSKLDDAGKSDRSIRGHSTG
jgi:hypothetical protein